MNEARNTIQDACRYTASDLLDLFLGDVPNFKSLFVGEKVAGRLFGSLEAALIKHELVQNEDDGNKLLSVRYHVDRPNCHRYDIARLNGNTYIGINLPFCNNHRPTDLDVVIAYAQVFRTFKHPLIYSVSDVRFEFATDIKEYLSEDF